MSKSFDERCHLYLEAVKEQKTIMGILSGEVNLKRQKIQNEVTQMLILHKDEPLVQNRILTFFWTKVCYSTITGIRKNGRQIKRGSAQEAECRNFMFSMYSFFQNISFNYVDCNTARFVDWLHSPESTESRFPNEDKKCFLEKILVYQGDIARYLLEIEDSPTFESFSKRCYMQAMAVNPSSTQPMCQLGILMSSKNFRVDSVFWYLRALHISEDSLKVKSNLDRILQKNARLYKESSAVNTVATMPPKDFLEFLCKRFSASLIYVIGSLVFKKESDMPKRNELNQCFQNILSGFSEMCKFFWCAFQHTPLFLNDSILFNCVIMCIITLDYLEKRRSGMNELVSSFVLTFFAKLVHLTVLRLDFFTSSIMPMERTSSSKHVKNGSGKMQNISKISLGTEEVHKSKRVSGRRRRRRRAARLSPDVLSEDEDANGGVLELRTADDDSMSSSNDDDEDGSASAGFDSDDSSNQNGDIMILDDVDDSQNNSQPESTDKWDLKPDASDSVIDPTKLLMSLYNFEVAKSLPKLSDVPVSVKARDRIWTNENVSIKQKFLAAMEDTDFMASIKVIVDWLNESESRKHLLKDHALLHYLIALVNRLPPNSFYPQFKDDGFKELQLSPLMEDFALRNVKFLPVRFASLDWNRPHLSKAEENFVRLAELHRFIKSLSLDDDFNIEKKSEEEFASHFEGDLDFLSFSTAEDFETERKESAGIEISEKERQKIKLMENMGQLRLKSEVERLRKEVEQISSNSPFIFPEAYCFTNRLDLIRKLAESNKFVIVVCKSVLNSLDSMKRDQPSAREAIKFLESALSLSNTCIRAQKDYEYSLVDLSAVNFNWRRSRKLVGLCDMISCANYFVQSPSSNLVTHFKQATLLFESAPDPSNMGIILNSLGSENPIGFEVLEGFCQKVLDK